MEAINENAAKPPRPRGRPRRSAPKVKEKVPFHADKRTQIAMDALRDMGDAAIGMESVYGDPRVIRDDPDYYKRLGWIPVVINGTQRNHLGDPVFMRNAQEAQAERKRVAEASIAGFDSAFEGKSMGDGVRDSQGKVHRPFIEPKETRDSRR